METIKNLNINKQEEEIDPRTILWGIFDTEIMPTGAVDTERSAFQNIEQRLLQKEISPQEAIKEAWAIVYSRQNYH